ncbi:O-antigen ligase family protein [Mycobacterium sp. pW049]|uniref:O-antigen ligase family protein n=1 Tax=[Mycobacterium] bulgaricum TaxID=3238985 RepID=UPI00351BC2A8
MSSDIGFNKDADVGAGTRDSGVSSRWMMAFCAGAFLFFLGLLAHVFGEGGGRVGVLRGLFVPVASAIQLTTLVLLFRPKRVGGTLDLLRRNGILTVALALIMMSTIWSLDPAITLRRAFALLGTTALGLLIYIEVGRANLLRFFAVNLALFVAGSVIVALAIPELGTHPSGVFAGNWRGLVDDKNGVAPIAVVFLLVWLGLRKRGWMATWNILWLAFGILLLFRAGSATGFASFVFGVGVFGMLAVYRRRRLLRPLVVVAAATVCLFAALNYSAIFQQSLQMLDRDATLTGRTAMWQALAPMINDRFWLGSGYGAFWYDPSSYTGFIGSTRWMADMNYAHNAYIDMLLNVGIIGLIIQLIFLFIVCGRLFAGAARNDNVAMTMLVVLLTLLFVGIVDTGALFRANAGLWVMVVAFACYASHCRARSPEGRGPLEESR